MKVVLFAVVATFFIGCTISPESKRNSRLEIHSGIQGSSARKVLTQNLGEEFPDSTYAVCGKKGHFAVISEVDDELRIVYFCEGNKSNKIQCVGRDTLLTPLGECTLPLNEALQLKGNFLLLINPSHGSGYAAWLPEVYILDDWSRRQTTREEFIQFSWPEEWTVYYECKTTFDELNGKLYAKSDTSHYDRNHQLVRSSIGRKQLISVD